VARSLYSTRFIAVQGLAGTGASVTVPPGMVYIVKQVTLYSNPLLGQVHAFFEDGVSGAALFSAGWNPGTPAWFGFYGALTFLEGQTFHFQVDVTAGDAADVYAGGYSLTR
jgi:hypothetical protein